MRGCSARSVISSIQAKIKNRITMGHLSHQTGYLDLFFTFLKVHSPSSKNIDQGFINDQKLPNIAEIKAIPTHQTTQTKIGVMFFKGLGSPINPIIISRINKLIEMALKIICMDLCDRKLISLNLRRLICDWFVSVELGVEKKIIIRKEKPTVLPAPVRYNHKGSGKS